MQYGLTLHDVASRVADNNANFASGYIEHAADISASVIPFSMLVSFLGMRFFGISANLMSLGAIDFGMIVDGAVVMMENSVHRLEQQHHGPESPTESIRHAAHEVARPMTF